MLVWLSITYNPAMHQSNSKLCQQASEKGKVNLFRNSVFSSISLLRRASLALYAAWTLLSCICVFTYGSHDTRHSLVGLEISLMYFTGFLLYIVLSRALAGVTGATPYLEMLMQAHQLLLVSISLLKMIVGTAQDRLWHGCRCLLMAICVLPELGPTTDWINNLLAERNNST